MGGDAEHKADEDHGAAEAHFKDKTKRGSTITVSGEQLDILTAVLGETWARRHVHPLPASAPGGKNKVDSPKAGPTARIIQGKKDQDTIWQVVYTLSLYEKAIANEDYDQARLIEGAKAALKKVTDEAGNAQLGAVVSVDVPAKGGTTVPLQLVLQHTPMVDGEKARDRDPRDGGYGSGSEGYGKIAVSVGPDANAPCRQWFHKQVDYRAAVDKALDGFRPGKKALEEHFKKARERALTKAQQAVEAERDLGREAFYYERDGKLYVVTEYVGDRDLFSELAARDFKRRTIEERLSLFKQVLQQACQLHKQGKVHRDLKTENIVCHGQPVNKLSVIDLSTADTPSPDADRKREGTIEYMTAHNARQTSDSNHYESNMGVDHHALAVMLAEILPEFMTLEEPPEVGRAPIHVRLRTQAVITREARSPQKKRMISNNYAEIANLFNLLEASQYLSQVADRAAASKDLDDILAETLSPPSDDVTPTPHPYAYAALIMRALHPNNRRHTTTDKDRIRRCERMLSHLLLCRQEMLKKITDLAPKEASTPCGKAQDLQALVRTIYNHLKAVYEDCYKHNHTYAIHDGRLGNSERQRTREQTDAIRVETENRLDRLLRDVSSCILEIENADPLSDPELAGAKNRIEEMLSEIQADLKQAASPSADGDEAEKKTAQKVLPALIKKCNAALKQIQKDASEYKLLSLDKRKEQLVELRKKHACQYAELECEVIQHANSLSDISKDECNKLFETMRSPHVNTLYSIADHANKQAEESAEKGNTHAELAYRQIVVLCQRALHQALVISDTFPHLSAAERTDKLTVIHNQLSDTVLEVNKKLQVHGVLGELWQDLDLLCHVTQNMHTIHEKTNHAVSLERLHTQCVTIRDRAEAEASSCDGDETKIRACQATFKAVLIDVERAVVAAARANRRKSRFSCRADNSWKTYLDRYITKAIEPRFACDALQAQYLSARDSKSLSNIDLSRHTTTEADTTAPQTSARLAGDDAHDTPHWLEEGRTSAATGSHTATFRRSMSGEGTDTEQTGPSPT